MTSHDLEALGRQLLDQTANQGNLAAVDEFFAPHYVEHNAPPGVPPTRDGIKMLLGGPRAAFPDL